MKATFDPCSCKNIRLKFTYAKHCEKNDEWFESTYSPLNYFKDHQHELFCVDHQSKVVFNKNFHKPWLPKCVSGTTRRDQNVFFKIGYDCQDRYITIDKSVKIPICGTEDGEFSSKLDAALHNEATWFLLVIEPIVLTSLAVLILFIVVYLKKWSKSLNKRQDSVINPVYGMSHGQDYGYYTETGNEETNSHYETYYKDDYNTNITDYNEIYGKEKK